MIKGRSKTNREAYGILFIIPYFIAFLIFSLYPIIYSLIISFKKWDGMSPNAAFVGLHNYINLIHDHVFYQSIINTFVIWGVSIIPQIIFAIVLAVLFNNSKFKGREFFRAVYYLPNLVTPAAVAVLFAFLFDWQTGAINKFFMGAHIFSQPFNWFQSIFASRGIISLIGWWMWFGYSMIIFGAGLKNIPSELYEAASIDGASAWQSFWSITLPLLRQTMLYTCITSLIGGMQTFDIPYVITGGNGGPTNKTLTMVMYLYNTAFKNSNYGYGAAIGYGLFVLILVFSAISYKFINRKADYE